MFSSFLQFFVDHGDFYSYSYNNGYTVIFHFGLDTLFFLFVFFLTIKLVFDVMESYL